MAEKKITKKEKFGMLLEMEEIKGNEMLTEFIKNEIALLEKKASKSGQTKKNKENEVLMEIIATELGKLDRAVTVTELQKESTVLGEYSNQKLSAMLKKMFEENHTVEKSVDGKKSLFRLATAE